MKFTSDELPEEERKALERFLDRAEQEMFPKVKSSCMVIMTPWDKEPDAKVCLELGAAIFFNKPLLVIVNRDDRVPLALRTIATKIVEIDAMDDAAKCAISAAMKEMAEMIR